MSAAEAEPVTDPDTSTAGSSEAEIEYAEADRILAEHMAASFRPASSPDDSGEAPRPEVCRCMPSASVDTPVVLLSWLLFVVMPCNR